MKDKFYGAQWISGAEYDYGTDDADFFSGHEAGAGYRNHVLVREFELGEVPTAVTLRLAVLGFARVRINGERVGNEELLGDWTNPTKLVYFDEWDVIRLLHAGRNELSIELGNGWYNPSPLTMFGKYNLRERLAEVGTPQALVALMDEDKNEPILVSDESWTYLSGQLLFNNCYLGETRDLSWTYDEPQTVVARANERKLAPAVVERCCTFMPMPPVVRRLRKDHSIVLDFGQTITGFLDLRFAGNEGTEVRVRYAETAEHGGSREPAFESSYAGLVGELVPEGFRIPGGPGAPERAEQLDRILCANGEQRFTNEFCVHSFRYAVIEGLRREDLLEAYAIPVHTDLTWSGMLLTSNSALNELYAAALRTKLNNVHGMWEDCARERLGYGGDMVALSASNLMCFDCEGLIRKTVRDFRSDQTAAGGLPETAPFVGIGTKGTAPGEGPLLWQLAYPHLLLRAHQFYGADDLVREEWPYVRKHVDYLLSWDLEELAGHCLGDHGSLATGGDIKSATPDKELAGWAAIARIVRCGARLAHIAGEEADAKRLNLAYQNIRAKIVERFAHEDGAFGDGTMTGLAFAADLGLGDETKLTQRLADAVRANDGILATGIFGTAIAYDLLHRHGHDEVLEGWLMHEGHPSLLNMLSNGNGVLAEQFETFLSSFNHAMFSSYAQWFWQALAGIRVADDACACDRVELRPYFSKRCDFVRASFATRKGTIRVEWERSEDGGLAYYAEVPRAIGLEVHVPDDVQVDIERS